MSTKYEYPRTQVEPMRDATADDLNEALDLSLRFAAGMHDRKWHELDSLARSSGNTRTTVWVRGSMASAVKITITTGEAEARTYEDDEGKPDSYLASLYTVTAEDWSGDQWRALATAERDIYTSDLTTAIGMNDSQPTLQHEMCATKVFDQLLQLAEAVA